MKVGLLQGDDWVGLYLNGKLVMEGHSLHLDKVLELLLGEDSVEYRHCYEADQWDEWGSRAPETWSRVLLDLPEDIW